MRWLALVAVLGGCDLVFRLDAVGEPPAPPDAGPIVGRWIDVAAGQTHTCAIDLDRHLWCWGNNGSGQVGIASAEGEVDTISQVGDATWTLVRTTHAHNCGLQTDGSLWCWGWSSNGQIGDGTTANAIAPKRIADGAWIDADAGVAHSCAIRDDHSLWCWGLNNNAQLGDGTTVQETLMVPIASSISFDHVSAGSDFTCAIATGGALYCWGANDWGQLGLGMTSATSTPTPVQVGSDTWSQITTGMAFACGITTAGQARCWGNDTLGQLGDGGTATHAAPTPVLVGGVDGTSWTAISAGRSQVLALTSDNHLYGWGHSAFGQLAMDTPDPVSPTEIPGGAWMAASGGAAHSCAVAKDQTLWCTGADGVNQLGDGGTSAQAPVRVTGSITRVSVGLGHVCAIDASGALSCTGDNSSSQLGTGDSVPRRTLTNVTGGITQVSAGAGHTCAIDGANKVYCWGANYSGQLGTGNTSYYATPQLIRAGKWLDNGSNHTCTIDPSTNTMYCWGRESEGQLGNKLKPQPAGTGSPTPFPIPTQTWRTFTTGASFTCATLLAGNVVYCWGADSLGQDGNGATGENIDPATGSTGLVADQLAAGGYHACGINSSTHAMSCWGANYYGQLGLGDGTGRASPTVVPGAWKATAGGLETNCAIKMDGTLWCSGVNSRGQLGIGSRTNAEYSMKQVGTDIDWDQVATGTSTTCAIKLDGSLWCWGDNSFGQLGTDNAWRTMLIQVP